MRENVCGRQCNLRRDAPDPRGNLAADGNPGPARMALALLSAFISIALFDRKGEPKLPKEAAT